MRMPTFNKQEETAVCMFCKKNRVPLKKWNKPCEDCKAKQVKGKTKQNGGVTIGKRLPAAVWEDENGNRVFVDKFNKPVQEHGYDLEKDPRGWDKTGKLRKKTII